MKRSLRACLGVIAVGSLLAFAGCGDDDDSGNPSTGGKTSTGGSGNVGGAPDGGLECQVIGELCHEADTGSGPAHDCHETGHEGTAAACVKDFASCIHTCVTDADDLGTGGAGAAPDPLCAALGELCHEVDDKTGPLHECHEVGHIGVAATCVKEFDSCATQCLAARALLEAGGAGGGDAGGVTGAGGAQSAGAGGVAAGGMSAGGAGGSP
jgi:hypothetical protein